MVSRSQSLLVIRSERFQDVADESVDLECEGKTHPSNASMDHREGVVALGDDTLWYGYLSRAMAKRVE